MIPLWLSADPSLHQAMCQKVIMSKQVELVIKHPAETINAMFLETNIVSADFKRQLAYCRRSCVKIPVFAGGVAI